MFEKVLKSGTKYSFLPFIYDYFGVDKVEQVTKTEQLADRSVAQHETGWDRIQRMFRVDEFGNVSYEANSILQTGIMSLFVGALYGGVMQSRVAYTNFMKTNEATSFTNHIEAKWQRIYFARTCRMHQRLSHFPMEFLSFESITKSKLQHAVTTAFGKGAMRVGWRLALFSTSFVGITTLMQVYRGKYGITEYVTAGGLTGGMYKFYMGPRGWIVGGGLGAALGLVCGATTMGILSLTGISIEEARYWQYQWKDGKKEFYRQELANYMEREDFAVIKLHNDAVGDKGRHIDNIDTNIVDSNSNKKDVEQK